MGAITAGDIVTNDGVRLHYEIAGSGRPLVLIHGWEQSGSLWKKQVDDLSADYRVVTYDQRGHGKSGKPDHGYKVHRLAADLNDLLTQLDLDEIVLVGHSMGCQIALAYIELFGQGRVQQLVLVDEPVFMTSDPAWDAATLLATGAIFDQEAVLGAANGLRDPETNEATVRGFIDLLTTPEIDPTDKEWIVEQNLLVDGSHSAALFYNHAHQDWRSQLPLITVPTLVIGAAASPVPVDAMRHAAEQIADSTFVAFDADEGGGHFMFIENPTKFNATLREFIG